LSRADISPKDRASLNEQRLNVEIDVRTRIHPQATRRPRRITDLDRALVIDRIVLGIESVEVKLGPIGHIKGGAWWYSHCAASRNPELAVGGSYRLENANGSIHNQIERRHLVPTARELERRRARAIAERKPVGQPQVFTRCVRYHG